MHYSSRPYRPMQGPVRFHHRKFFRRSHDATLRPAHAGRPRPPSSRAAGGPASAPAFQARIDAGEQGEQP